MNPQKCQQKVFQDLSVRECQSFPVAVVVNAVASLGKTPKPYSVRVHCRDMEMCHLPGLQ